MDKRDVALQASMPTICVPRFSELASPTKFGERVLVAANGVFIEVTRKWGKFVRCISPIVMPLPYGTLINTTEITSTKLPKHLLLDFDQMARASSHVEIGASIVWNEVTGEYRLVAAESLSATSGSLNYKLAPLKAGEHLVIDCHSHSYHSAYFSPTDDEDDMHAIKFSYVVGNCDLATQTRVLRLCIKGIFEPVPI